MTKSLFIHNSILITLLTYAQAYFLDSTIAISLVDLGEFAHLLYQRFRAFPW